MLKMLSSVERIPQLIPKLKQQLIFLEERDKLFRKINDESISYDELSSNESTKPKPPILCPTNSQLSPTASVNSTISYSTQSPNAQLASKISIDNSKFDQTVTGAGASSSSFPDEYPIPPLPKALLKDIEAGVLTSFRPHFQGRQILIDAVVHDLIENYNLFYPTKTQYSVIGAALVKCLKLPSTSNNLAIWKDALQTKLKRIRSDHPENDLIHEFRTKYSKPSSGRPVKQRIGETVDRDRHKQMLITPHDEMSDDIQSKIEQLKSLTSVDTTNRTCLWKDTFLFRRQVVRDQSTSEIVKMFPAYSDAFLVFEEIKMLTKIDLRSEVRRQIPMLLSKLVDSPMFITDSPPIQLIKVLCKYFNETAQLILCDKDPPTPYPTLVCVDDLIHIYVDFIRTTSTTSPDDALALLIGMYTIFELSFDKKSRTIRFLYCVLHGEKQFLSNSIRVLIKDKNIEIIQQHSQASSISISSTSSRIETLTGESENQSKTGTDVTFHSTVDVSPSPANQTTALTICTKNSDAAAGTCDTVDKSNDHNANTPLSPVYPKSRTNKGRKRRQNVGENDLSDTHSNNDSQCNNESSSNGLALNDVTNSVVISQRVKRTRRA